MKNFLSLIVVLALASGGGWYWWINTPDYALKQAGEAAKMHDVAAFEHWVDVDRFSSQAVEDLLSAPVRTTGAGILGRLLGLGLMSLFHEPVSQALKQQIVEFVGRDPAAARPEPEPERRGGFLKQLVRMIKPPALGKVLKEMGFTKENYRGVKYIKAKDDRATAGMAFFIPSADKDVIVEFGMAKINNQWRVREILNLGELAKTVALSGPDPDASETVRPAEQ